MEIQAYPTGEYDFAGLVRNILGVPELGFLHKYLRPPREPESDQDSAAHRAFYAGFDEALSQCYSTFISNVIYPLFGEPICAQRVPTFRVSMPGSTAVSEYHRDSDYNHQPATVNFWLPLTDAFGTNTIWIESGPRCGDFRPVDLTVGQFLCFDAINLAHGNQTNRTGRTRVSFDFRIIPYSRYEQTVRQTVTNRVPLSLGHYYSLYGPTGLLEPPPGAAARAGVAGAGGRAPHH